MPEKKAYAVMDTNILVSALWTENPESPPVKIIDYVFNGRIVPIVHRKILREYDRVLHYDKFSFPESDIKNIVNAFKRNGIKKRAAKSLEEFSDESDRVFYAVTLAARKKHDARLVTGNTKHFPQKEFVVTARAFLNLLETDCV